MTSWGGVSVAMVLVVAQALPGSARAADSRRMTCLGEAEMRDAMVAQKAIPATRAVAEALRDGSGETVAIHLCRSGETALVYDVAVLRRDGHLVHVIVDAKTGLLQQGRKQP